MSTQSFNLVICFNQGYLQPSLISAFSYLKTSQLNLNLVFIIDETVNSKDLDNINKIFPESKTIKIKSSEVKELFSSRPRGGSWGISAYYRLYTLNQLPDALTLYVDADTICIRNLLPLIDYAAELVANSNIYKCAAVSHYRPHPREFKDFKLRDPYRCFNSGVLLFNPKTLLKVVNFDSINSTIKLLGDKIKYADQCILNFLLKDQILWLPMAFNMMTWHFDKDHFGYNREDNLLVDLNQLSPDKAYATVRIAHYTATRPWNIKKAARNEFLSFWTKAEEGYCGRIQTSSVI